MMKIEKLRRKAVRSTRKIDDVVYLPNPELRKVVSGGNGMIDEVDPEICAIHDYYLSDLVD